MEGGRAAVYVRSTMETGVVKLTGKCRDLDSCEIQINFVKPNGTFCFLSGFGNIHKNKLV